MSCGAVSYRKRCKDRDAFTLRLARIYMYMHPYTYIHTHTNIRLPANFPPTYIQLDLFSLPREKKQR